MKAFLFFILFIIVLSAWSATSIDQVNCYSVDQDRFLEVKSDKNNLQFVFFNEANKAIIKNEILFKGFSRSNDNIFIFEFAQSVLMIDTAVEMESYPPQFHGKLMTKDSLVPEIWEMNCYINENIK